MMAGIGITLAAVIVVVAFLPERGSQRLAVYTL
jgi:hypothetical protein